ncbi:unnamed protein product [Urochloa decumbens]|uniref:Uncharacterized protein n=1 Tax=Urochloa decumbens TaxID=240449 RepID=A0ABC8Z0C8_9POAL
MEMESGSDASERGRAAVGGEGEQQMRRRRSRSAPPGKMLRELTARERRRAEVLLFTWQVVVLAYVDMTEEEVEDEYRRAGKLHRYDPDTELEKRIARLARRWPPPDGFMPKIDEYLKILDDDEREDGDIGQLYQEKDY